MKVFHEASDLLTRCRNGSDLDMGGGDQMTGVYLYQKQRIRLINCPALSTQMTIPIPSYMVISYHRPKESWLQRWRID
jgi:hypothetical protein